MPKDKFELEIMQHKQVIDAFKKIAAKAHFSSGIQAWISSVDDTITIEESIEYLNEVAENYNKDEALHQIVFLMNAYTISLSDIENLISKLKENGWPNYLPKS